MLRRRRMVRAFQRRAVDPAVLDRICEAARRAPAAGNTQALDLLVLDEPAAVARYWATTFPDEQRREGFRWQGLFAAPVLVVPYVAPGAYVARYGEADKASSGLGREEAWPVPYWWVDGGMAVVLLLAGVVDEGLGACFVGQFDHEPAVRDAFGVPADRRALGTVVLGHPAPDEPGRSATRSRRPLADVVHRGRW